MFRDLKEYQEIQNIYQQSVYKSQEEKLIEEVISDYTTIDELEALRDNLDYVFEDYIINEGKGFIRNQASKFFNPIKDKIDDAIRLIRKKKNIKNLDKTDDAKKIQDKLDKTKENLTKKNELNVDKTQKPNNKDVKPNNKDVKPNNKDTKPNNKDTKPNNKDTKPNNKDTKPNNKDTKPNNKDTKKGNPIKDLATGATVVGGAALLSQGGDNPKASETPSDTTDDDKKDDTKVDVKVDKKVETKPKRLTSREKMRKRNEILHGKERVDYLRRQNTAFQKARNKKDKSYTMDDFVKEFPKSQTAKRRELKKLGGPEAFESYNPIKDYHTANDLAEVYRNMYNTSSEPENLDEGVKKEIIKKTAQGVKKVGKLIRQGVRKAGQEGGPQKPKKGFYNVKSGPNTETDFSTMKRVRPEGGGKRRVKATYGKKPEKSFMQSQKDKLEAQRQGISVKELDAARKAKEEAVKDAVARERAPRTGVDLTKGRTPTKRTNFQDKNFKPKYEGYEPYDVVLEYLLQSEIASTIEEANNIMIEMDNETIEEIITELMVETIVRPDGTATHGAQYHREKANQRKTAREKMKEKMGPRGQKPSKPDRPAGPKKQMVESQAGIRNLVKGIVKSTKAAGGSTKSVGKRAGEIGKVIAAGASGLAAGMGTGKALKKEDFGYDAYDLILEYLLGTEQVDTIEEANYVMSEMDQQTIHDIVLEMEDALNQLDENMALGMTNVAKSVGGMVGNSLGPASSMLLKGARKAAELLKKAPKNNPIPTGTKVNPSTSATGFPSKRMSGGGSY